MYRGSKSQQSLTECHVIFADDDPTTVREAASMGQWVEARPPIRRPKQSSNWNVRRMERQSLPPMREHVASALVGRTLYLFGGAGGGDLRTNKMFTLDLETLAWSPVLDFKGTTPPEARSKHSMIARGDSLVIFGGASHERATRGCVLRDKRVVPGYVRSTRKRAPRSQLCTGAFH